MRCKYTWQFIFRENVTAIAELEKKNVWDTFIEEFLYTDVYDHQNNSLTT